MSRGRAEEEKAFVSKPFTIIVFEHCQVLEFYFRKISSVRLEVLLVPKCNKVFLDNELHQLLITETKIQNTGIPLHTDVADHQEGFNCTFGDRLHGTCMIEQQ
jgi:hypothetical protein